MKSLSILIMTAALTLSGMAHAESTINTASIEQITGLKGKYSEEEHVFKISKPRTDVKVEVDQHSLPPFMGLTSWAAFTPAHGQIMMMGDTVVFEDEVNPVMDAAFAAGLEVTAIHNHFFFDRPKVYFMHIGAMGDETQLARGVKKVYDRIAEVRRAHPEPLSQFVGDVDQQNGITPEPLQKILGQKGEAKDGMFKVTIGRRAKMHGAEVGKAMGINTWAAFAGSDAHAVVDGDFVMLAEEVQPVLKAMRQGGINIVALHNHMVDEAPHYYFMHYWGKGKAEALAETIRHALDVQKN